MALDLSKKELVPHDSCCRRLPGYSAINDFLNEYLWKDEREDTPEKPVFSRAERWNIMFYITGIMLYKFGLESYLGSARSLAVDRFTEQNLPVFLYQGYMEGFYAASQCVGTILVGPFMKFLPVKTVLAWSLFCISVISSVIMIKEKIGGGGFPDKCVSVDGLPPKCAVKAVPGDYPAIDIIIVVVIAGIPYGMIEIIRRIIPQQIVGNNENKLKKLDSLVHVFYEVAGTTGAFFSAYVSLLLGKAYGQVISPPLFMLAFISYSFIVPPAHIELIPLETGTPIAIIGSFFYALWLSILGFFDSVWQGGKILFFEPKFQWLFFGYAIPLVMHRYIENGIDQVYAKLVLKESAYASFIISGSNAGELLGALFVFFNLNTFKTPLPTLRWDAMMLNLTWLFYNVITPESVNLDPANTAGVMAAIMAFISAGWAAGDVSTAAFIQKHIPFIKTPGIDRAKALASVMSFLYVSYIVIYAVISPAIGNWTDSYIDNKLKLIKKTSSKYKAAQETLRVQAEEQKKAYFYWIAGVFFSLISIPIFLNTFIPKGSWTFNPRFDELDEETRRAELEEEARIAAERDPDAVPTTENPSPR